MAFPANVIRLGLRIHNWLLNTHTILYFILIGVKSILLLRVAGDLQGSDLYWLVFVFGRRAHTHWHEHRRKAVRAFLMPFSPHAGINYHNGASSGSSQFHAMQVHLNA